MNQGLDTDENESGAEADAPPPMPEADCGEPGTVSVELPPEAPYPVVEGGFDVSQGAADEGGAPGADAAGDAPAGDGEVPDGDGIGDGEEEPDGPSLPLVSVVEALLFAAREPLKPAQIARAAGKGARQDAVRGAVDELNVLYLESGRAFEIAEISGRFQLMSRPEYVNHIRRIYPKNEVEGKNAPARLTQTALETLSIVAYKQPVTRGEIEHVRGVACGSALKTLLERGTIKVVGKKDVPGQPLMYGTTEAFLAEFGLGSLDELPLRGDLLRAAEELERQAAPEE